MDNKFLVGKYDSRFNEILNVNYESLDIYSSDGLPIHMKKRKHDNCLKYIENIPEIIIIQNLIIQIMSSPLGVRPHEQKPIMSDKIS